MKHLIITIDKVTHLVFISCCFKLFLYSPF